MIKFILWLFYTLVGFITKIMGYVFLALFVFSVLSQIVTYKRKRKVNVKSLAISSGISILLILVYKYLGGMSFISNPWWINYALIPVLGAGVGIFLASSQRLFVQKGEILTQGTIWYLLIWLISWGAIQLIYLAPKLSFTWLKVLNIAVYGTLFSTSLIVSTNIASILRYKKVKALLGNLKK